MRQWFVFNTVDSRNMGLYISRMPDIVRPAERVEYKDVPGRAGSLSFKEGENVFDGYERSITVYHLREQPLNGVLEWLRGEGELILSNEPDRAYIADLAAQIAFSPVDNSWEQAVVTFFVQPYKKQYPPELPVKIAANDTDITIWNPGNIPAKPIITLPTLDSGGNHSIVVNGTTYEFGWDTEDTPGTVTVDCGAEIITSDTGLMFDAMDISNGFPVLEVGENTVSVHGFDIDGDEQNGAVTIAPEWRWI